MVTMELTFLFIYFICFIYIFVGSWEVLVTAVLDCCQLYVVVIRRSNLLFCKQRDLDLGLANQIYWRVTYVSFTF